jgi:hypothetical protein
MISANEAKLLSGFCSDKLLTSKEDWLKHIDIRIQKAAFVEGHSMTWVNVPFKFYTDIVESLELLGFEILVDFGLDVNRYFREKIHLEIKWSRYLDARVADNPKA